MFINIYKDTCLLIFTKTHGCLFTHTHTYIYLYLDTDNVYIYTRDMFICIYTQTHVY